MPRLWLSLFALTALAAGLLSAPPASAEIYYPWCAQYGGSSDGGGTNCGFVSLAQCHQTIDGMGGFCVPNPFYTGPAERPAKSARKAKSN